MAVLVTKYLDAVHGAYYLGAHAWLQVFGMDHWSIRVISSIAVGVAAAGVVVLGRRIASLRVGILSGLIFAIIPQVTWMGTEARSYALTAAIAVWLTIAFLKATTRSRYWIVYGALAFLAVTVFIYLALLLVAHGITLLILREYRSRRNLQWFTVAAVAAAVLSSPVIYFSYAQKAQVAWIPQLGLKTIDQVLLEQWFGGSVLFAVIAWAAMIFYFVSTASAPSNRIGPSSSRNNALLGLWIALPTTAILLASAISDPLYIPRYLSFCLPAVALVIGIVVSRLRVRLAAIALVVLLLASIPTYIEQRTESARGNDWIEVSAYLDGRVEPGDGVYFNTEVRDTSDRTRLLMVFYPSIFQGVNDFAIESSFKVNDALFDTTVPLSQAAGKLSETSRIWVIYGSGLAWEGSEEQAALAGLGFEQAEYEQGLVTDVRLLVRTLPER
jgi:mannosyltransferase